MGETDHRPITGADCERWAALLAAAEQVDDTAENYSAADLIEELADPNIDPARDTRGRWLGDKLIGYASVRGGNAAVAGAYRVHVEGTVDPAYRRQGHGQPLLDWALGRAREVHAERHPDAVGVAAARGSETNHAQQAMLERAGFTRARWFFQLERPVADPPPLALPPDLELIPFDRRYDEQTRLAHNEAFADHWGSAPSTPESWAHWSMGSHTFRPAVSFLMLDHARAGNPVVGYLLSYEYEADTAATGIREAYVGSLGTRRAWRGRGVARALLSRAIAAYRDAGYQRTALDVDADSPTGALGLYTSIGYAKVRTSISFARPLN
jgi:mycothiol synthase